MVERMSRRRRERLGPRREPEILINEVFGTREQETVPELSRRHQVHANQIYKWKRQLLENIERAFEVDEGNGGDGSGRESELLQKIGELTVERDFLSRGLGRFR